jgi:hypothetical protein
MYEYLTANCSGYELFKLKAKTFRIVCRKFLKMLLKLIKLMMEQFPDAPVQALGFRAASYEAAF